MASQSKVSLPTKLPGETIPEPVDFISKLPAGVSISSVNATVASVLSGNDPNPAAIISGAASSSGTVVTQVVTGGVLGTVYSLLFSVNGSDGGVYQITAILAVAPVA